MRYTKFIIFLITVFTIFSCAKENELGNLSGTWKFGSAFVNGIGTNASGTITFDATNTGEIDIWVIVENDTIFKQGTFTYTETTEAVDLSLNNTSLILNRSVNKKREQEFEFFETVNNVEYGVILDLIPN